MLEGIRREKPRYVREQYLILQKLTELFPAEIVHEALKFCLERKLYCAADCLDIAGWLEQEQSIQAPPMQAVTMPNWLKVKAEKRDPAAYACLTGGELR